MNKFGKFFLSALFAIGLLALGSLVSAEPQNDGTTDMQKIDSDNSQKEEPKLKGNVSATRGNAQAEQPGLKGQSASTDQSASSKNVNEPNGNGNQQGVNEDGGVNEPDGNNNQSGSNN